MHSGPKTCVFLTVPRASILASWCLRESFTVEKALYFGVFDFLINSPISEITKSFFLFFEIEPSYL